LEQGSGRDFPMNVSPVLTGLTMGSIHTPSVQTVDESKYANQAREFAEVVNERNKDGRPQIKLQSDSPAQDLKRSQTNTYVVELLLDTVVDQPLGRIDLSPQRISNLPEKIDVDHAHFDITGAFVQQALMTGDVEFQNLRPDKHYLLSVFDLRNYDCDVMKSGIDDYFSRSPDKEKLHNDSIYVISELSLNRPEDLSHAEKYFGRRPDALIHERTIYADHLLKGAATYFAFFNEGNRTRIVMLSNLAMKSKFFKGAKGLVLRQYILDGVTGGAVGSVTREVIAAKDALSDLLAGAEEDVRKKNACNHGLALGLIRYSESLFSQFVSQL